MYSSIMIVMSSRDEEIGGALVAALRKHLGGWSVTTRYSDGDSASAGAETPQVIVVVLSPSNNKITLEAGVGKILNELGSLADTSVYPVILPGANMPSLEELPEIMRWLYFTNAIIFEMHKTSQGAQQLVDAVRSGATFEEPAAPSKILIDSLRLGFRPMIFGPLWAILAVVLSLASAMAILIALPSLRANRRMGGLFLSILWVAGIMSGMVLGRRWRSLGVPAGAVIGAILPWLPMFVVVAIMIATSSIHGFFFGSSPGYYDYLGAAMFVGIPSAIVLPLILAGRAAKCATDTGKNTGITHSIFWIFLLGLAGFISGVVVGWSLSFSGAVSQSAWAFLLMAMPQITASGVLMGLLCGVSEALQIRKRGKQRPATDAQNSSPPSDALDVITYPGELSNKWRPNYSSARTIFLSYRRRDSAIATQRIYLELTRRMKGIHVFRDVDSIPFGLDFKAVLQEEVARCDVFVAVIGPKWLTIADENGLRMLDRPGDFVRMEIELAIERRVPILVALVDGASKPEMSEIPECLRSIASSCDVSIPSYNEMGLLIRAIAESPAAPRRRLAKRERIASAIELAIKRACKWGMVAALAGVVASVAAAPRSFGILEKIVYVASLLLIPAGGGWVVGRRLGVRVLPWLMLIAMPFVVFALLSTVFFLGAIPGIIWRAFVLGERAATPMWTLFVAGLTYASGLTGLLTSLLALVRRRVQRLRVWNAVFRVLGGVVVGVLSGLLSGLSLIALLPPSKWPWTYSGLQWIAFLTISASTLGLLDGAAYGWTIKEK